MGARHYSVQENYLLYTGRPRDLMDSPADWDTTPGLYNVRHRLYHPSLARWMTNDPIGYNAGDVNLYRYVGNGPIVRSDPSGLVAQVKCECEHLMMFGGAPYYTYPIVDCPGAAAIACRAACSSGSSLMRWTGEFWVAGALPAVDQSTVGFCNSLKDSVCSMALTYKGIGQWATGQCNDSHETWNKAYDLGVLGQTNGPSGAFLTYPARSDGPS